MDVLCVPFVFPVREDLSMKSIKLLLAGESWITYSIHQKGFNAFTEGCYAEGATSLVRALRESGIEVHYMKAHEAPIEFPQTLDAINEYDTVLLSDIGSDSLLLHPDTFSRSETTPDRLELLKEWVGGGGGFGMIGGYLSFQGHGGSAHYRFTPVEDILPVELYDGDDRIEKPAGFKPVVLQDHEITRGFPEQWPLLLGYNKVKAQGEVLVKAAGDDPLLVVGEHDRGRTAAFTSDCSPHWGSPEFVAWSHYGEFWFRLVSWLAGRL
jgi:uncharacterized membrane protein